jgi:Rrf2 family cysteine metabolism transcriptional repressor
MKLSVKSDYACRAIEALALHYPNTRPLRIDEIAGTAAIPANYLVQILIELKGNGLIQSRRGKAGGYLLSRPPREISVGDVVRAAEGEVFALSSPANSASPQELQRAWNRIRVAAESMADSITFDLLCAEAMGRGPMYYI